MRSILPAAGVAILVAAAFACRQPRLEPENGNGSDPPPAASPTRAPRVAEATTLAAVSPQPNVESPFAPMVRGSWREAKGSHTYAVTVNGSRFVAVEFQKDREIGRYEGVLRGRQVDATYVSSTKGPVEGRAALELSNDGSHLAGAFTFNEQFTPIEWIRN